MISLRELLNLPQPTLDYNPRTHKGTIYAHPGENISVQKSADIIARVCCPSCARFKDNNPEKFAVCNGMDTQTSTANVKRIGHSTPQEAVTTILMISKCAPRK